MRRRDVLAALPAVLAFGPAASAASRRTAERVRRMAQRLSLKPYVPPDAPLPPELAALDYDGYRRLHFRAEQAVWRDRPLPFQLQMFPRGGLHTRRVELFEVADGDVRPIAYSPELFSFDHLGESVRRPDVGFAGFRLHAPINDPSRFEEFAVFLGASYFRAVPRGGVYGLSARAIEVGSGQPNEEFPGFRAFYIERPMPGATSITLHGLLDGPSVAGAYTFVITPGDPTAFDVDAVLFPRRPLANVGLAPLTSMFLFGAANADPYDDFRPEVHDSDGLLLGRLTGMREWCPLGNPSAVRVSRFDDVQAAGFGLAQRQRSFEAYQDLEALYHRRPGTWVEPLGAWGPGAVQLVELPARSEAEDNIVASWRPAGPLPPLKPYPFRYRLSWSAQPEPQAPLARAAAWRVGRGDAAPWRRILVEFSPLDAGGLTNGTAEVSATAGAVRHVTVQPNPNTGGARLAFEFDPGDAPSSELRAELRRGGAPISETWRAQWPA